MNEQTMDEIELLAFDTPYEQLRNAESDLSRLVEERFGSLEEFTQEVADLTNKGFGVGTTVEDVKNHVFPVDRLYLAFEDSKLMAFASFDHHHFVGKRVLYLSGIIVDPECQKQGVFTYINRTEIEANGQDYLVMRTQNPVIYGATKRHLTETLYPNGENATDEALLIAAATAIHYNYPLLQLQDYFDHLVVRGAYGTSFYDSIPFDRDGTSVFDNLKLDYQKGDAVVLVGKVNSSGKK